MKTIKMRATHRELKYNGTYEVTDARADALVNTGYAEYAGIPEPEPVHEPEHVETAAAEEPVEEAVQPTPRSKHKKRAAKKKGK